MRAFLRRRPAPPRVRPALSGRSLQNFFAPAGTGSRLSWWAIFPSAVCRQASAARFFTLRKHHGVTSPYPESARPASRHPAAPVAGRRPGADHRRRTGSTAAVAAFGCDHADTALAGPRGRDHRGPRGPPATHGGRDFVMRGGRLLAWSRGASAATIRAFNSRHRRRFHPNRPTRMPTCMEGGAETRQPLRRSLR